MEYVRNGDRARSRKPTRFVDECRCLIGGHFSVPCPIALSKEARRNTFDKLRSRRIAAMMETMPDLDNTSESNSSEDEYSSEESSDEIIQEVSEQERQLLEKKKQLKQHTSGLLLKLTQCLRICKRKVDTLSPKVFRPNVSQLRGAVEIALFVAERAKCTSVSSATALHRMTLRASTISNLFYIADNMHSTSSYYFLVRIRNSLKLASRVAAAMHAYVGKIASFDSEPQVEGDNCKLSAQSKSGSTEMEDGGAMDLNEQSQQDKEDKTQDVQMAEEDQACNSLTDKPQASVNDFAIANRKYSRFSGKCRYASGEQSSKPSQLVISKEARKAAFDRNRSKRMDTMIKRNSFSDDSDSETDDSDYSTDDSASDDESSDDDDTGSLSDESSDEGSDESSDEISDEESEKISKQQRLMKLKKKMRQQTATFLIQLTKCLSTCKKEVYTLPPSVVRPDITKLRDAVDNALFMTDRIKCVSIKSTASLKAMTQTAATIAHVVYIPDSMHSAATRASYHKLLRIRRFLNLAMQVTTVLHTYTEKIYSAKFNPQASKVKECKISDRRKNGRCHEDVKEKPQIVQKLEQSPCQSTLMRVEFEHSNRSTNTKQMMNEPTVIQLPVSDRQRKANAALSVAPSSGVSSAKITNKLKYTTNPVLSTDMPLPQSMTVNTLFSQVQNYDEGANSVQMQSGSAQQKHKPEISMDKLADLFGSTCKISKSMSCNYCNMSFKDPRGHELTSAVIPREQYPGVALQDGGVKFVLQQSPLTESLRCRKLEGKDLNILSQNMLNAPQSTIVRSTGGVKSLAPFLISPTAAQQGHSLLSTDVEHAAMKKPASRPMLKATKRRLHPNLSNVVVARKSPQSGCNTDGDIGEYRRIMGANVEVLTINDTVNKPRAVRLGKRNATEAGLPVPKAK